MLQYFLYLISIDYICSVIATDNVNMCPCIKKWTEILITWNLLEMEA